MKIYVNQTVENSKLEIPSISPSIKTVTSNYDILVTDFTILVDCTLGNITITLPSVSGKTNMFNIQKIDSSSNDVIITVTDGLIKGDTTLIITDQWSSATLQTNGTNWYLI